MQFHWLLWWLGVIIYWTSTLCEIWHTLPHLILLTSLEGRIIIISFYSWTDGARTLPPERHQEWRTRNASVAQLRPLPPSTELNAQPGAEFQDNGQKELEPRDPEAWVLKAAPGSRASDLLLNHSRLLLPINIKIGAYLGLRSAVTVIAGTGKCSVTGRACGLT